MTKKISRSSHVGVCLWVRVATRGRASIPQNLRFMQKAAQSV